MAAGCKRIGCDYIRAGTHIGLMHLLDLLWIVHVGNSTPGGAVHLAA